MKYLILSLVLGMSMARPAFAGESGKNLTVEETVLLANALEQLSNYTGTCKDGGSEKSCQKLYNFGAGTRWTMSANLYEAKRIRDIYVSARNALIVQMANGGTEVPADKANEFRESDRALYLKSIDVTFGTLRRDDLKLDENPIPPAVLSALMPIMERK